MRFHASCANLGKKELQESGSESGYCPNSKAECSQSSGLVLNCHKAVQCDKCDMWEHNDCSFLSDSQYITMQNINCTWICPKYDSRWFFLFYVSLLSSDSVHARIGRVHSGDNIIGQSFKMAEKDDTCDATGKFDILSLHFHPQNKLGF